MVSASLGKKIKLVIFDLDGVLIDSRMIHFHSLNKALEDMPGKQYVITMDEHLSTYDGLGTTRKLQLLSLNKGLDPKWYQQIWEQKQLYTEKLYEEIQRSQKHVDMCKRLMRETGVKIAVASNSVSRTMCRALDQLGMTPYLDIAVSTDDVSKGKPDPEMYWKCMTVCGALPKETLVIEDSHIGRTGAVNSGAHVMAVKDQDDFTVEDIIEEIETINEIAETQKNVPWMDRKLNVVIPMAGKGSRFSSAGFTFPKPLIEVYGKPMIQLVVENINIEANYIFIVQKEHYEKYNLKPMLNMLKPGCKIIQTDGVTEGAACTLLLAKELINNDNPLLIVNSDQYMEWNSNEAMYAFSADGIDGGILTFDATSPKWSYVSIGDDGFVSDVREKEVISRNATCGVYYWRRGCDYVRNAEEMVSKNIRVNNEFYVAPVYTQAIRAGARIRVKEIKGMWSIGTPEDLNYFLMKGPNIP